MQERKQKKIEKMYAGYRKKFRGIAEMTAQKALKIYDTEQIHFIDVRRPEEQAVSMLPGALTEEAFLASPSKDKGIILLCYCTVGYRSGLFVQKHQEQYPQLHNLCGGILLWLYAGGKIEANGRESNKVHVYGRKWALQPPGYQAIY